MAHSIHIKYKEKGFWINESFIEILSQYVCEVIENIGLNNLSQNLKNIYFSLDGNRSGEFSGMVNILMDDYIVTNTDRDILIAILEQAKTLIASKGSQLNVTILNQFEDNKSDPVFKIEWVYPIRTQSLIATLEIIQELLSETYPYSNRSIHYIGFPDDNAEENI